MLLKTLQRLYAEMRQQIVEESYSARRRLVKRWHPLEWSSVKTETLPTGEVQELTAIRVLFDIDSKSASSIN